MRKAENAHETGHLVLGNDDLLAAPGSEGTVQRDESDRESVRAVAYGRKSGNPRRGSNVGRRSEAHMSALRDSSWTSVRFSSLREGNSGTYTL